MLSKRELLARTLEKTGLGPLLSQTTGRWQGLVVFNYHRLGNQTTSPFDRALYSADQEIFEQQVQFLKKHYDVVRVADLEGVLHNRGRAVMITFDDGYLDNYELAFPVLKQHNVPATFFITSGFLDGGPVAWWDEIAWMVRNSPASELPPVLHECPAVSLRDAPDREQAVKTLLRFYKSLPIDLTVPFLQRLASLTGRGRCPTALGRDVWMNWDMIREMDQGGMDIGGHTVSHPVLSKTSTAMQRQEIFGSKLRIEQEIGHTVEAFSYPVGQPDSFTEETKQILRDAGYRWAFSFSGGFSPTGHQDDFDLPRVAVSPHLSRDLFRSMARLPWLFA